MKRLMGKRALITGGTSGIGKATTSLFLSEGAAVAVNYHRGGAKTEKAEAEFRKLLESSGQEQSQLLMIKANISEEEEVHAMFAHVFEKWGGLDILVNNAGVQSEKSSHELSKEDLMKDLGVNLLGTVFCSVAALRIFVENDIKGCILNNTSVHEKVPKPKFLPYSISKGGIRNLTQTLALEYADRGIRVNSVAPGVVDTPMNEALDDEEARENILDHIPQGRVIAPEEVAECFLYLACDEAKNITGQTLFIDSGLSLYPAFAENWSST